MHTQCIKVNLQPLSDVQPVLGYLIYMADISSGGDYKLVYDGSRNPILHTYTVCLLTPGKRYGFKVQAINFNGKGPMSDPQIFVSCEAPAELAPPIIQKATETTLTLYWQLPKSTGG